MGQSRECFRRQLAAGGGMAAPHGEHERVLKQRVHGEALARMVEITDRQVKLAAVEQVDDVKRASRADIEVHRWRRRGHRHDDPR